MLFALGCCFFLLFDVVRATPQDMVRQSHKDMKKYEKNAQDLVLLDRKKGEKFQSFAESISSDSLKKMGNSRKDVISLINNLSKEDDQGEDVNQKGKGCSYCSGKTDTFEKILQEERGHQGAPGDLLIFISFSMPKEVIKGLLQEAHENGARVIIRGLIDNSWKKTAQVMQSIYGSIDIDPEAFEQYGIKSVPTFVHVKEEGFDTLRGNVPLSYALQTFSIKGKETS